MLAYVLRRLFIGAVVFVAASFVAFSVFAAPLDPLWKVRGPVMTPQLQQRMAQLQDEYHLNEPAVEQWWHWAKGTVTGASSATTTVCGGRGIDCYHFPVWPDVWSAAKQTALLAGTSAVVVIVFSLVIGTLAAVGPGSVLDTFLRAGSYFTWAIPAFVVAVLLQLLLRHLQLAYDIEPFPISGHPHPGEAGTGLHYVAIWAQHLAMPVLAISIGFIGYYSRFVRSAILAQLGESYAWTARAKGLKERQVVVSHVLRNSLTPFVSLVTLDFGAIFGATLVADYIFQQGGLGQALVGAVYNSDPFQVQPLVLIGAVSVILFSLIGDLITSRLDPRVTVTAG